MVSLEDEMKQKDKEAAVLKANHKYEIMLNIEIERIEKCKRTYENFHNFEVAVMQERRKRILKKQCELNVIKNVSELGKEITDMQQDIGTGPTSITCEWGGRSQQSARTVGKYFPNNNKTNSRRILNHTGNIPDRTKVTQPPVQHRQPKGNSNYAVIPISERDHNLRRAQYANVIRTRSNVALVARSTSKPNERARTLHPSVVDDVVKFPVLDSVSPPGKSSRTTNFSMVASTVQQHAHFQEKFTETRSRDVRTSTVPGSGKTKKSHRPKMEDNLTPFDQYRLRLQESEQRTRKPKHHFTRAISAMDTTGARNMDDEFMALRRARSADAQ